MSRRGTIVRSTYVLPRVQSGRVDSILVESLPLLKCILGILVVLLGIPLQHCGLEFDANALAELTHDSLRVVEKIVCVDDADLDLVRVVGMSVGVSVGMPVGMPVGMTIGMSNCLLASDLGSDDASVLEIVENTALLVIPSFSRHEVVEASNLVKRRYRATPVAGNAVARVTNQKGEMELSEDFAGDDGRVARLRDCRVRIWCIVLRIAIDAISIA